MIFNIPVCDEIIPNLYLGNNAAAKDLNLLKSNQITHILTVGNELECHYEAEFTYKHLKVFDLESQNIKRYFDDSSQWIDDAIEQKGNVFVHWYFFNTVMQEYHEVLQWQFHILFIRVIHSNKLLIQPEKSILKHYQIISLFLNLRSMKKSHQEEKFAYVNVLSFERIRIDLLTQQIQLE